MSVALRILFVFAVSLTQSVAADDWPNWRGPHHDGISRESNWTPKGIEQPVWKASIGLGYSCVAISDGRLFTMGYDQEESVDVVSCLDAASGKELWRQSYPAQRWNKYHSGGTNSTPVVNGDRVYTINREGKFHCFDSKTGKIIWSKNVHEDFDARLPTWGFSVSPLVVNDRIILNVDRVLAFNAQSGALLWKTTPYGSGYSTPVPFDELGEPGLAVMNGLGLVVIRSTDGSEIAQYEWKTQEDVNAATPVVVGNRLFISSGYNHGAALIEFTSDGAKAVWETKKMRNKMATSILWNDHLYGFDESVLKCMDLNGNEKWRKPRLGPGALTAADGKLVVLTSGGDLAIVKATPDGYEELARSHVLDSGVYWTMPVVSGGMIYCRNSIGELVCLDHRKSTVAANQNSGSSEGSAKKKSLLPITHGISANIVEAYWKKGTPPPANTEFLQIARRVGIPEAIAVFYAVRKIDTTYVPFEFKQWRDIGWYQLSQGNAREAVLVNTVLVEAFPKVADSYRRLADAMVAIHEEGEAIKLLKQCLELDSEHLHARSLLEQLED